MTLENNGADPASFRDPSGHVHHIDRKILRTILAHGEHAFTSVWQSGILQRMSASGRMIASDLLPVGDPLHQTLQARHILTHPKLDLITYPYEWPFAALKSAALAHLDLHLALLSQGFTLSDASAYNIQFIGTRPLHIDPLSIIPYENGMRWAGYRQFLHQFFNPLILEAITGVSFTPYLRASLEGIDSATLLSLLPKHHWLRPAIALHVAAPAYGERRSQPLEQGKMAILTPLLKSRYIGLLKHLRSIIEPLRPRREGGWHGYNATTSYNTANATAKQAIVARFIESTRPALLLDIGCNSGDFARHALASGATRAIGIDSDRAAVNAAFQHGSTHFTPLVMDIANPSPSQGWRGIERPGFTKRIKPDAIMALALIHHLAIGNNIPLPHIAHYLTSLAPRGLLEFVPKSDPQVTGMLQLRPDIFPDYTLDAFKTHLSQHANISEHPIGDSGRILLQFERTA